ncbi:MAG: histidine ammonia-lyase [Bdellovibrionota bacterium]
MEITGNSITIDSLWQTVHGKDKLTLSASARSVVTTSRSYINKRLQAGEVMYGVNTGFGAFSSVRISDEQIRELQQNLIRSHSAGVGEPFSVVESKAMMILRANALARGHSGIRPEVIDKILEFYNKEIIPYIPSQGSVGASGDLAPLSHLALALIGEGRVWDLTTGKSKPAAEVLKSVGVAPLILEHKEGLSLINGCQVMTGVGALALYEMKRLSKLFDVAGCLSLEALQGSRKAFDELISAVRPHSGEIKTATNLRKFLGPESAIAKGHADCDKVQDAYSLRCMPAVHGAYKNTLAYVAQVVETESNSSTDNPLVFAEENKILSCGNFHGMPVSMAMDFATIALSSLANISSCRIAQLINPATSGLPAFLTPQGGFNSGHMIVQVAAAALVSENKVLSHPASVDSIPTSADKEDHVSMGSIAARKLAKVLLNCKNVLAMEFLSATQGLDLLHPLKPEGNIANVHTLIRKHVPFAKQDRIFSEDINRIVELIDSGELLATAEKGGELSW